MVIYRHNKTFSTARVMCALIAAAAMSVSGGCGHDATGENQPAAASSTTPVKTVAPAAGPHVQFDSLQHDFGVMSETETRSASLHFKNDGDETLIISSVTTTCGCTAATPNKLQYAPGETGEIDIRFEPSGPNEPGEPQRKYVNIITNSTGADGPTKITVIADVRAFVVIEPRMVEFGVVDLGTTRSIDVIVSCTDPQYTFERIAVTNEFFDGELVDNPSEKSEEKNNSNSRIVRLSIDKNAPWGNLFGWLEIIVTGRPSLDQKPITHTSRVRVQAQVFGELAGEPDTFRFGVKPNETFDRQVIISHRKGEVFEIRSAVVACTSVHDATVMVQRIAPDQIELTLRAVANELVGASQSRSARGTVTITTSVAGRESTVEIPIVGVVRESVQH